MKTTVRGKFVLTLTIVSLLTFGATLLHAWKSFRNLSELAVDYEKKAGELAIEESTRFLTENTLKELRQDAVDQARTIGAKLSFCANLLMKAAKESPHTGLESKGSLSASSFPAFPFGKVPARKQDKINVPTFYYPAELSPEKRKADIQYLQGLISAFDFIQGEELAISRIYAATGNGVMLLMQGPALPGDFHLSFRPWFRQWQKAPHGVRWTGLYYSGAAGKGEWVLGCTVPMKDAAGKIRGVIGADIRLATFVESILTVSGKENIGKMNFILDSNGKFLAGNAPFMKRFASGENASFFTPDAHKRLLKKNPALAALQKNMQSGKSGTSLIREQTGKDSFFVGYAPVRPYHMSIGVLQEKESIFAPGRLLGDKLAALRQKSGESLRELIVLELLKSFILLPLLLALLLLGAYWAGFQLSKPVCKLIENAKIIGSGNLSFRSELKTGDELERLSDTLNQMSDSLKVYIDELHQAAADRVRIKTELKAAARIQSSMLPSPLPENPSLLLAGKMLPAREVGGDLYDYVLLDEGKKLYFAIGDVSGKGIPAALFMAKAQNVMRLLALRGESPEAILSYTNSYLEKENPDCIFLTVFCGILDLANGILSCCNAGHNPPLFLRKERTGFWNGEKGFVLGVFPEKEGEKFFKEERLSLAPGEGILLYTDGVTEAENPRLEQYGKEALASLAGEWKNGEEKNVQELLEKIMESVRLFAGNAPQSDDITLLYLQYQGKEIK